MYLSIDYGTQSVRALIINDVGEILVKTQVETPPYSQPQPGWAEQDAMELWQKLCEACAILWQKAPEYKALIKAVTLTTQRGSVFNVDKDGRPLRPGILWLDQRQTETPPKLKFPWHPLFRAIGVLPIVEHFGRQAEINWIKNHEPEVWNKTDRFLLLSGFLTFHLIGDFVDSRGNQVGYLPFDFKRHAWLKPASWKWQMLAVRPDMLPRLVPQGTVMGTISTQAARATGIPTGLPLIAAAADKACETLGAGSFASSSGALSFGTNSTISITSERYIEAIPLIPPFPAAVADLYAIEMQLYRGFWLISWFKKEFGHPEIARAAELDTSPEALLDRLLDEVAPGSDGLLVQPFFSPGVRFPPPEAKGAIIGLHSGHTRAHIYRALIEGIMFALHEGRLRIESRSGIKINELRVSGGGARSDQVLQIAADVFNLPVYRPHTHETSGLGAAIIAAVAMGDHPNYQTAINAMTRVEKVFKPDKDAASRYAMLYNEVYAKLYETLHPLYKVMKQYNLDGHRM